MKTFSPGQIASAKDVNDNFAELKKSTDHLQQVVNSLANNGLLTITGIPIKGSVNRGAKPIKVSAGQVVINSDSTGFARITHSLNLSTVLLEIAISADWNAVAHVAVRHRDGNSFDVGYMSPGGQSIKNGPGRINFLVIGW